MEPYSRPYEVRWTDIDANRHVRYSAYVDAAAELRYHYFSDHGVPPDAFNRLGVGPVYTNMQINFYREVMLGETLTVTFQLAGISPLGIRWKVRHDFLKANGKKAVTLFIEGTFLDLTTRQPALPTAELLAVFQEAPRTSDFVVMSDSRWFEKEAVSR